MKVPSTLEMRNRFGAFLTSSCQLGRRTAPSFATATLVPSCAACSNSSASANKPISTGMNSMPSVKEWMPKV